MSGTLNWSDGDAAAKTFTVAPIDDVGFEGNEIFSLFFSMRLSRLPDLILPIGTS